MLVFNDFADSFFKVRAAEIDRVKSLSCREELSGFIDERFDIVSLETHILSLDMEGMSLVDDFRVDSAHELYYYTLTYPDIKLCFADFIDKGGQDGIIKSSFGRENDYRY